MKLKYCTVLFFILLTTQLVAFQLPKRILKKVQKELVKTFDSEELTLESMQISARIHSQLTKRMGTENLFKVRKDTLVIGYAFIDKAPSKTDQFDYLILLDKALIIKKTKVLVYREDYGGEIGSRRWLKQFIGKSSKDQLKYRRDIMAISGATISAVAMTQAVNEFLADVAILHQNHIF
jgi:Na+-translocating ferredoxin:NAD+ oxidoreductase RnfG subunit